MRKFVFWFSMSVMAVHGGLVSAQDAYGAYSYHQPPVAPQPMGTPPVQTRYLRWRPLVDESGEATDGSTNGRAGPYPGTGDYTDEPPGVPPGTYRRIEERHTITPNLEGYRFRPIEPEEQMRNRSRNVNQEQAERERIFSQTTDSAGGAENSYGTGQPPPLIFRPDPRLDKGLRQAPPRYAFPMGSATPMFRPSP